MMRSLWTYRSALIIMVTTWTFSGTINAQIDDVRSIPTYDAPELDMAKVHAEDRRRMVLGELSLYGRRLALDVHTKNEGTWSEENGDVWRARIRSVGALATELFFDEVNVPAGATMAILSDRGDLIHGPFTAEEIGTGGYFTTPLVEGDASIVEYRVPHGSLERGGFRITDVGHAYRDIEEGPCNVDVACSPEGDAWQDAASAVVRISVVVPAGTGWCTGTVVNNVRQDCTPYVLTAWHCGSTSTAAHFNQYKFYFNFKYSNCGGGTYSTSQYRTGAQLKAYSNDNSGNAGSDFMLLQLNADIPGTYHPYFAGWDATSTSTSTADGVCIHHPTGAPKKISTYTQTLTTGHWVTSSGLMSHWRVYWTSTPNGHGITESGSSGGSLWRLNASGDPQVIGTLSGSTGGLSCSNPGTTTFFGKLSYHWTNNPNTSVQKLKYWLDPDDTGMLQLTGTYAPCSVEAGIEEVDGHLLRIWPNPATDEFQVQLDGPIERGTELCVYDATGRIVHQDGLMAIPQYAITTRGWASGVYSVVLMQNERPTLSTILIITP